jgi:hypothetical protein
MATSKVRGVDFAKESDAGTLWQVTSHPRLEAFDLVTQLMNEFEASALVRGRAQGEAWRRPW